MIQKRVHMEPSLGQEGERSSMYSYITFHTAFTRMLSSSDIKYCVMKEIDLFHHFNTTVIKLGNMILFYTSKSTTANQLECKHKSLEQSFPATIDRMDRQLTPLDA